MPSANKGDYDRAREAQRERDKSGPTAKDRPKARPDVVKTGTGKDTRYMDTRTGQSYAAPSYGAFSFRGLTSTDPANVARNRYGAERAMSAQSGRDGPSASDRGIASLPAAQQETPATPPRTPAELAAIGAPNRPMAPIFVAPPTYTAYDQLDQLGPVGGYGTAFNTLGDPYPILDLNRLYNQYQNPFQGMDQMDIFAPYSIMARRS